MNKPPERPADGAVFKSKDGFIYDKCQFNGFNLTRFQILQGSFFL